jgi:hypothetical protein
VTRTASSGVSRAGTSHRTSRPARESRFGWATSGSWCRSPAHQSGGRRAVPGCPADPKPDDAWVIGMKNTRPFALALPGRARAGDAGSATPGGWLNGSAGTEVIEPAALAETRLPLPARRSVSM